MRKLIETGDHISVGMMISISDPIHNYHTIGRVNTKKSISNITWLLELTLHDRSIILLHVYFDAVDIALKRRYKVMQHDNLDAMLFRIEYNL